MVTLYILGYSDGQKSIFSCWPIKYKTFTVHENEIIHPSLAEIEILDMLLICLSLCEFSTRDVKNNNIIPSTHCICLYTT